MSPTEAHRGRAFFLRPRSLCGALLILAAAVAVPLAAAAVSVPTTPIRDTILPASGARQLTTSAAYWGGTVTASTGERVTIRVSDSYPQDLAVTQRWANFLASLLHGSELETVVVYLAPLREVQSICGRSALACYNPRARMLYSPGEAPPPATTTPGRLSITVRSAGRRTCRSAPARAPATSFRAPRTARTIA